MKPLMGNKMSKVYQLAPSRTGTESESKVEVMALMAEVMAGRGSIPPFDTYLWGIGD